jgi:hypothetical protein
VIPVASGMRLIYLWPHGFCLTVFLVELFDRDSAMPDLIRTATGLYGTPRILGEPAEPSKERVAA